MNIRSDWTIEEVSNIFNTPLLDLIYKAASVHREHNDASEMQLCQLLSIKTGGCTEDCSYCSQSARNKTDVKAQKLLDIEEVMEKAREVKGKGISRFCLGAAWRGIRDSGDFDRILEMVRQISQMGLEVCCTMGIVSEFQAKRFKEAGLDAYNHNIDTSPSYYPKIITTRNFADRLKTLYHLREANISVCCGGIIGMGESDRDRIELLHTLATFPIHPESVPINVLIPVKGTPLENVKPPSIWEFVRMIAAARILMPKSFIRLSGGRIFYSKSEIALCFLAGGNSMHVGEKLLTACNPELDDDLAFLDILGLKGKASSKHKEAVASHA